MNWQTAPIQIGRMPVGIVCTSEARIAFVRLAQFKTIFDINATEILAIFDQENFVIRGEQYQYNMLYAYKENPDMLQWLNRQQLLNPFTKEIENDTTDNSGTVD